ncbi:MAG: DUF2752 domain-containing protein [Actinobacteria bacterium]|nr:DUF2752 domain-containing protein [Actinomycetota bacterium]
MNPHGRRWTPVVAAGSLALTALVTVGFQDPENGGIYPPCLSAALGIACPLCGGLRGTHDLLQGDVASMLDHNALIPLYLAVLTALFIGWVWSRVQPIGPRAVRTVQILAIAVVVISVGFGVLRNFIPYLAPAAGA